MIHGILPVQFMCLTNLFAQSLYKCSLVYLMIWHPPLHAPYIFSPNHCLLFITHAHSIATCFAVVQKLYHLILLSLSSVLGTLSFSLMPHIRLTILISARRSATSISFLQASFSFLMDQVSLPCNVLLCTQLLYNLHVIINDISLLVPTV